MASTNEDDANVKKELPLHVSPEHFLPGAIVPDKAVASPRSSGVNRDIVRHVSNDRQDQGARGDRVERKDIRHTQDSSHSHDKPRPSMHRQHSRASLIQHHRSRMCHTPSNQNFTIFAKIANDETFQNVTLLIIVINALWIGVDTEWNHGNIQKDKDLDSAPLSPVSDVIENTFCFYFTVEVTIRFLAFERKLYFWRDLWFDFDSFLVLCMVFETWVIAIVQFVAGNDGGNSPDFLSSFSALRLLRLLRLTRMMRLMRQVPELMILVKGIISASKAVFFIMLFLVLNMYIFAIVFTSQIGDPGAELEEGYNAPYLFATMGDSMMTLFTNGVLGDNLADTVDALATYSIPLMWVFWLFNFISAMTLLNMLIGVLCEVITNTATTENEGMEESVLKFVIEDAFSEIDANQDGKVSETEWCKIKSNDYVQFAFVGAGLDATRIEEELDELKIGIFGKTVCKKGLTLEELNEKVLEIRPGKKGSLLTLKMLEKKQHMDTLELEKEMQRLEKEFRKAINGRNVAFPRLDGDDARLQQNGLGNKGLQELPIHMLLQALKGRLISPSLAAMVDEVDQAWERNAWEEHWSSDYKQYYYINRETGETSWEGPSNPQAWQQLWSADYERNYYINQESGETRWQVPTYPEVLRDSALRVQSENLVPCLMASPRIAVSESLKTDGTIE